MDKWLPIVAIFPGIPRLIAYNPAVLLRHMFLHSHNFPDAVQNNSMCGQVHCQHKKKPSLFLSCVVTHLYVTDKATHI